jgi:hypothetical protein
MKILHLSHLYSGQCLSHHWLCALPADPANYPHDHGYRIVWKGIILGECRVVERKTLKVAAINPTLAGVITGYSAKHLLTDMADRGMSTAEDASFYLFHFEYTAYFEGFKKAISQAFEMNQCKNSHSKAFQLSL